MVHSGAHALLARQLTRRSFLASWAVPLVAARREGAGIPSRAERYSRDQFEHGGIELQVWTRGEGPLVFILHEIDGLTENGFVLGDDLIDKGFSVAIPRFFGALGGAFPAGYVKACEFRGLFSCFDIADYGRIMPWIKALARHRSGNGKFGAIGNCLTGALPLLMMRSSRCVAPVLCQPALPFQAPFMQGQAAALGLSEIDLDFAALRSSRDGVPILAIRYAEDGKCPRERFCTLRTRFASSLQCLELPGDGHSTLIGHRSKVAFDEVVGFLTRQLYGKVWSPSQTCPCAPPPAAVEKRP